MGGVISHPPTIQTGARGPHGGGKPLTSCSTDKMKTTKKERRKERERERERPVVPHVPVLTPADSAEHAPWGDPLPGVICAASKNDSIMSQFPPAFLAVASFCCCASGVAFCFLIFLVRLSRTRSWRGLSSARCGRASRTLQTACFCSRRTRNGRSTDRAGQCQARWRPVLALACADSRNCLERVQAGEHSAGRRDVRCDCMPLDPTSTFRTYAPPAPPPPPPPLSSFCLRRRFEKEEETMVNGDQQRSATPSTPPRIHEQQLLSCYLLPLRL